MGQRVLRSEDSRFLRGEGLYVENIDLPDALQVTFVRSPYAHARVVDVDASEALALPGTQVFTAADVGLGTFQPPPFPGLDQRMGRPFLAERVVRFAGDIVAVVLTESRADGVDAAELVAVDYDPLPAAVDPAQALAGEVLLFPEAGTNVCMSHPAERDESLFDGCDVARVGAPRQPAAGGVPARAARVRGRRRGRRAADDVALDADPASGSRSAGDDPRASSRATSVSWRLTSAVVSAPRCSASRRSWSPGWPGTRGARSAGPRRRSENMVAMNHGRAADPRLHDRREPGRSQVEAYRLRILQDVGAYPRIGAFLPGFTALMASGVYAIPRIEIEFTCVVTNTTPIGPFRGAGRPEATQAIERAMDLFAAELGIDPAEVRRGNFFAARRVPLHDRLRRALRLRRLRARTRPRARDGGLRRAAGGTAPTP